MTLYAPGESGNPDGLPSTYKPEYADLARKFCTLGATDSQLVDLLEISRATLYRWKSQFEEFADAIVDGKERADERVRQAIYDRACGYDYTEQQAIKVSDWNAEGKKIERIEVVEVTKHVPADIPAGKFWMGVRQGWTEKSAVALTGANGGPIETNARLDLSGLSDDQLRALAGIEIQAE